MQVMTRWLLRTLLIGALLIVGQSSCGGDGTYECCECFYMGQECAGHFGPQKFPNGITRTNCASLCAAQNSCPVSQVILSGNCID
jgi:hypothetical protein